MEEQELYREETGAYPGNVYGRKLKNLQEGNRRINREITKNVHRIIHREKTGEYTRRKQENLQGGNRSI